MSSNVWLVTGYYAATVKPPKQPGELAVQVRCEGESTRDMELAAFRGREDIGRVTCFEVPWRSGL